MNGYLAAEINSPDNLRKTKDIWLKSDDELRKVALKLVEKYLENKRAIFLAHARICYPVFDDTCNTMRKMFKFQYDITLEQSKDKMFDQQGERTTLYHSIDKIATTMKIFKGVQETKGRYSKISHEVEHEEIDNFIA